ncbi:hypothetical protein ABC347_00930 [Sphingomonas sp. 1P06PA]|uniref:hypothetical protein n=1 Tax=Sphingomonas sp. 1P06PA TaxID=554121 RepID=UPI0039A76124
MSGDGSASRAISPSFASASAERSSAPAVSAERAAEINSWADRTTARAENEFRENREAWTNKQYGELLARDGERLSFQPSFATDDRKAHLMRAAEHMVKRNHAARLAGINRAAEKLLAGETLESKKGDLGR